jgi:hypothetical protein
MHWIDSINLKLNSTEFYEADNFEGSSLSLGLYNGSVYRDIYSNRISKIIIYMQKDSITALCLSSLVVQIAFKKDIYCILNKDFYDIKGKKINLDQMPAAFLEYLKICDNVFRITSADSE